MAEPPPRPVYSTYSAEFWTVRPEEGVDYELPLNSMEHDHDHNYGLPIDYKINDDTIFTIPRAVQILYGPYMYQGVMDFRTERLQGLKSFLEKLGVAVELKPCLDHVNVVRMWFFEELLFSCKITSLMHGGDGELDPLCWEAATNLDRFLASVLKEFIGPQKVKVPFCPCFHPEEHKEQPQPATVATKAEEALGEEEEDDEEEDAEDEEEGDAEDEEDEGEEEDE